MKSNRRNFIQAFGLGAAAFGIGSQSAIADTSAKSTTDDGQVLFVGDNLSLANT
ncbi:MAG: hypothetical protein RI995_1190, partial [Bacteroidota bacterium]